MTRSANQLPTPNTPRPSANIARYQAVRRIRIDPKLMGPRSPSPCSRSAHGLNQAAGATGLNLASKLENEYVKRVAFDIPIDSPNGLGQIVSGYEPAGPAHQVFE